MPEAEDGRAPATRSASPVVIAVCTTCRTESEASPGLEMIAALRRLAPPGVAVRPVACLSVCRRPVTATLSGPDRYTYVFGDLEPQAGAGALAACASAYRTVPHGFLLWRERPELLRRGIVARIPPPDWASEDGSHPR